MSGLTPESREIIALGRAKDGPPEGSRARVRVGIVAATGAAFASTTATTGAAASVATSTWGAAGALAVKIAAATGLAVLGIVGASHLIGSTSTEATTATMASPPSSVIARAQGPVARRGAPSLAASSLANPGLAASSLANPGLAAPSLAASSLANPGLAEQTATAHAVAPQAAKQQGDLPRARPEPAAAIVAAPARAAVAVEGRTNVAAVVDAAGAEPRVGAPDGPGPSRAEAPSSAASLTGPVGHVRAPAASSSAGRDAREAPAPAPVVAAASEDGHTTSRGSAPTSTVDAEALLLQEAHGALFGGDALRALALLERHAAEFPHGVLAEERDAERVVALCAVGRAEEARGDAERFLREHPRSPLGPRVKAACAGR